VEIIIRNCELRVYETGVIYIHNTDTNTQMRVGSLGFVESHNDLSDIWDEIENRQVVMKVTDSLEEFDEQYVDSLEEITPDERHIDSVERMSPDIDSLDEANDQNSGVFDVIVIKPNR